LFDFLVDSEKILAYIEYYFFHIGLNVKLLQRIDPNQSNGHRNAAKNRLF